MPSSAKLGRGLDHLEAFKSLHSYKGYEPPVKNGWWYSTYTNTVELWETCPDSSNITLEQYHISPSIRDRDIVAYFKYRLKLVPFKLIS